MKKIITLIALLSASIYGKAQSCSAAGTGLDGNVNAEVVYNDTLYAGGIFTLAGGVSVNNIAKWDGTAWHDVDGGVTGPVTALAVYNGNLYVGGLFGFAGAISANNVAEWNGTAWAAVGHLNNEPSTFTLYNGNLIAGGFFNYDFSTSQHLYYIAQWNGSSWSAIGGNILNSSVTALTVWNNNLVVCGAFTSPATYIAQWDGSSWSGVGYLNKAINALTVFNGTLIAGGPFTQDNLGHTIDYLAQWDGSTWSSIGGGTNGQVYSLGIYDTRLIIGGNFSTAGSNNLPYLATWNGNNWIDFGAQMNGTVYALDTYQGSLFAGGSFTSTGGNSTPYIAQYHTHPLAVNNLIKNSDASSIYPNPCNGIFTIQIKNYELGVKNTIELYNLMGEKVYISNITSAHTQIDLSNVAKGIYSYRIINNTTGEAITSGKVITQ